MNLNRLTILIFLIIFSLQSLTKADDIREFQIEGMSVGDSLLDYMSKNQINNSKRNYFTDKRKYYVVYKASSLNTYEVVDIYLKTGDKNYEIRSIVGKLTAKNKKACLLKRKEITKQIDQFFPNSEKQTYDDVPHTYDKTGKSREYQTGYLLGKDYMDDHISITCTFFSEKIKKKNEWEDSLNVAATSAEIQSWFANDYD